MEANLMMYLNYVWKNYLEGEWLDPSYEDKSFQCFFQVREKWVNYCKQSKDR